MADKQLFGFNDEGVKRIVRSVRAYERIASLDRQNNTQPGGGNQIIQAQLTSRSDDDETFYTWTQARRINSTAWETLSDGLSGESDDVPAIDTTSLAARSDLTNAYVSMSRGVYKQTEGDDPPKFLPCFYIVSYVEQVPQYATDVKQAVAQNQLGFAPVRAQALL